MERDRIDDHRSVGFDAFVTPLRNCIVHWDRPLRSANRAGAPTRLVQTAKARPVAVPSSRPGRFAGAVPLGLSFLAASVLAFSTAGCASLPEPAPAAAAPSSASAGGTTIVAVAPPSPPAMTLPKFLGLDVAFAGVRGVGRCVRNHLGSRFPALEPRPPLRSLSDPANMSETASPAVKAAAKAKVEADAAAQKAKAIRYLASLGCGECYPDTEKALLSALEDCNEQIRYEAVRGLRKSIGDSCGCCRENSCCSPKLLEKLHELAYGVEPTGCPQEPSSRVRRNARLVIRGCGSAVPVAGPSLPREGPEMVVQSQTAPGRGSAGAETTSPAGAPAETVAKTPTAAATAGSASPTANRPARPADVAGPVPPPEASFPQRRAVIELDAEKAVVGSGTPDESATVGLLMPASDETAADAPRSAERHDSGRLQ